MIGQRLNRQQKEVIDGLETLMVQLQRLRQSGKIDGLENYNHIRMVQEAIEMIKNK